VLAQQRAARAVFSVSVKCGEHHAGPLQLYAAEWSSHPAAGHNEGTQQGLEDVLFFFFFLVYTTWLDRASSGPTSTVIDRRVRARKWQRDRAEVPSSYRITVG